MANNTFSLLLVTLFVGFLVGVSAKDYCVAKPFKYHSAAQAYLDYACGKYDCSAIQPGAPCFYPDTLLDHTSYAVNQEYRATGECPIWHGEITSTDPSHDNCHYP